MEAEGAAAPSAGVGRFWFVRKIRAEFVDAGQTASVTRQFAPAAGEVPAFVRCGRFLRIRSPRDFHHAECAIVFIQPEIQTGVGTTLSLVGARLKNSRRERSFLPRQPTRSREPRGRGTAAECRVEFEGDRHSIEPVGHKQFEGGKLSATVQKWKTETVQK